MFGWVKGSIRSISAAMVPLRKAEFPNIGKAIKHPVKTIGTALNSREVVVTLLRGDGIEHVPAVRFANVIFNHELGYGWMIMPGSARKLDGQTAYICSPDIPYTLQIHKAAKELDLNSEKEKTKEDPEIQGLGLPDKILKLTTQGLDQFAMAKWHAGFDEIGGNGMVFLFGLFGGVIVGLILTMLLLSLMAAFS